MRRIGLVFWHSYWGNISRPGYLLFTFGLPLFLVAVPTLVVFVAGLVVRTVLPATSPLPLGVVDGAAVFGDPASYGDEPVAMVAYATVGEAATALAAGEVQAYYHILPDYWQSGEVVLSYEVVPSQEVREMFEGWVRLQIQDRVPRHILARYYARDVISHQSLTSSESFSGDDFVEWILVFVLVYLVRSAGLFTSGYMYDSIASESRQRTIEIVLTSVSSLQFVVGKFSGLLLVGMTQLGIWGGGLFLAAVVGAAVFGFDLIERLSAWEHLGLAISMLLGAYVLDQILAAAAGMMRVSGGAGPQLFNTFSLATGLALVYAAYFLPRNPDTPLAVAASFIPLTSPIVLLVRVVASEVPGWQVALSQGLLWGSALLGLWGLRFLLRANLVSYAARFELRRWLRVRGEGRGEE
jgi:ABC-2 type transport system permease protein